ncbi:MAG: hypothetical protein M5T52_09060 [Ignavibacteriaceae bacterium]|nr:hypothetical protein [Ignavibacteriaceae bacterium]
MTKLLEKAFRKAAELSEDQQNIIAKWLLEELESERKWKKVFLNLKMFWISLLKKQLNNMKMGKQIN